jgi:hypothetical protein
MSTAQELRPRPRAVLFPEEPSSLAAALGAVFLAASATWVGLGGLVLHRFF